MPLTPVRPVITTILLFSDKISCPTSYKAPPQTGIRLPTAQKIDDQFLIRQAPSGPFDHFVKFFVPIKSLVPAPGGIELLEHGKQALLPQWTIVPIGKGHPHGLSQGRRTHKTVINTLFLNHINPA